jgi:hypothetical protein
MWRLRWQLVWRLTLVLGLKSAVWRFVGGWVLLVVKLRFVVRVGQLPWGSGIPQVWVSLVG